MPSLGLLASRFAVGAVATGAAAVPAAQRIGVILQSYGVTGAQKFVQLQGTIDDALTLFSLLAGAADILPHRGGGQGDLEAEPGDGIFIGLRRNTDPNVHTIDVHNVPGFWSSLKFKIRVK